MKIPIEHNGKLDIAWGKSRMDVNWQNREILWSDFVEKLTVTMRTHETYKDYMSFKTDRQSEIKDVGAFVMGRLANGKRKKGTVEFRSGLTLDLDFGKLSTWNIYQSLFPNAAVLHTTHKHSSDTPRFRLIIPLKRVVMADEYIAIARKVAGILGIDLFDPTTFQPERLMYLPSTSIDGEFIAEFQDGEWLDPDMILNTYTKWQDSSEWPVAASEKEAVTRQTTNKQEDPLTKPSFVGAFCRTYSISDAIETFLQDVYVSTDTENRYTYLQGSTALGLVTYEDKWAYSHHGSDPASGVLCNAFDLVRIHLFGYQDEKAKPGTPASKLPSYLQMVSLCLKDEQVREVISKEKIAEQARDFTPLVEGYEKPVEEDSSWRKNLQMDNRMKYLPSIENLMLIFNNDPVFKKGFGFNIFLEQERLLRDMPWRKLTPDTLCMTERDDAAVRRHLEKYYGIYSPNKVLDAFRNVMTENSYHPVRDYLNSLNWDGTPRLDSLFIDYLGAEDSPYTRAVTRKTLTAAVARVSRPGVKFDYMTTLVGKQGARKSTMIAKLGREWFSDSLPHLQGKDAYEQLQGVWILEVAELAGMKKAEVETIKNFISKPDDRYRAAYGRRAENHARQCIFIGSTNNQEFLMDQTGNRRFWPVQVLIQEPTKDIMKDFTDSEVGQVWAEAVMRYREGEPLYLSPDLEKSAGQVQADHAEQDPRSGLVSDYLDKLLPENWGKMTIYERREYLNGDDLAQKGTVKRNRVCAAEVWCEVLDGNRKDITRYNTKEILNMLRNIPGWVETKKVLRFFPYGLQKAFIRADVKQQLRHSLSKN